MSVTRTMVFEMPGTNSWTAVMKIFRTTTGPGLKVQKKDKNLLPWSLTRIGDNRALLSIEFENKAKLNKYLKTMAAVRKNVTADTGMQSWVYSGTVAASG